MVAVLAGLSGGCTLVNQPTEPSLEFAPVAPVIDVQSNVLPTGSVYTSSKEDSLFGEKRAYKVGDLVTVLLSESMQANRTSNVDVSRESSNNLLSPKQLANLASPGGFPLSDDSTLGGTVDSKGSGESSQVGSLSGSIAATVIEVLANGNLVIRGEKILTLSEGSEVIQIKGIVRREDIQPDNTVKSKRIANAQISYKNSGQIANAQKVPWLQNALLAFFPF